MTKLADQQVFALPRRRRTIDINTICAITQGLISGRTHVFYRVPVSLR
jgi:hypothetical protein